MGRSLFGITAANAKVIIKTKEIKLALQEAYKLKETGYSVNDIFTSIFLKKYFNLKKVDHRHQKLLFLMIF